MIYKHSRNIKAFIVALIGLLPIGLQAVSELTSVPYVGHDPCKRVAALELRQIDAGAQLGVLAGAALSEARQASVGVYDYLRDTSPSVITESEAQGVWGARLPVKQPVILQNIDAGGVKDVALSGDGQIQAIAAGSDGLIIRYGTHFKRFPVTLFNNGGGADSVDTVAIHPTRPWIIAGSSKASNSHAVEGIELNSDNPETWSVSPTVLANPFHPDAISSVRFSPDGKYLAALGTATGGVKAFTVGTTFTGWADANFPTTAPTGAVGHIAWMPDSTAFAILSAPTTPFLYQEDAAASEQITGAAISGVTTGLGLSFNHDGRKLAMIHDSDKVSVIDASDIDPTNWELFDTDGAGTTAITIPAVGTGSISVSNIAFHPQVDLLAVTDSDASAAEDSRDLHLLDLRASKPYRTVGTSAEVLWKTIPQQSTASVPPPGFVAGPIDIPYSVDGPSHLGGYGAAVQALAWQKDGSKLFLGSPGAPTGGGYEGPTFATIDTASDDYKEWKNLSGAESYLIDDATSHTLGKDVSVSTLSPNGRYLVTAAKNGTDFELVRRDLTDLEFGSKVTLSAIDSIEAIAWSPDSEFLFVGHTLTAGTAPTIQAYDKTLSPKGSAVTANGVINSIAVRSRGVNGASTGSDYIAVGITTSVTSAGSAQQDITIDFLEYDRSGSTLTALAPAAGFASHSLGKGAADADYKVRVAMDGAKLVTAAKYDSDVVGNLEADNHPEVKCWNMAAFFSTGTLGDLPITAEKTINSSISGFTSVPGNWHDATAEITSIDINSTGTHIVSGDDNGYLYITDISGTTPKHVDRNPTQYNSGTVVVDDVKFSKRPDSTTTTPNKLEQDGLCRLIVKLSDVETETLGTDGDVYVYDAATLDSTTLDDQATAGAPDPIVHSYDSNALGLISALHGIQFHEDRVVFVRTDEAHVQEFNRLITAMAQAIKDQIDFSRSTANNIVSRNCARMLAVAGGIDLSVTNNSTALNTAIDLAITYLLGDTTQNDVAGAARIIAKNLTTYIKPDDLNFSKAAVSRFVKFTDPGPGVDSTHLEHPQLVVQRDMDSFILSNEKLGVDANRIYRLLRNQISSSETDSVKMDTAASAGEHKHFKAVAAAANDHGLASGRYAATLGYPEDGKDLGTVAFDHVTEFTHLTATERARRASKELTEHLRRKGRTHTDDRMCKALAQQAQNYVNFGRDLIDCMGILPVSKAGIKMDVVNDMTWSHDGKYLFVAADTDGLLVFDKDGCFIKQFAVSDFVGSAVATEVYSVSAHPSVSYLAVGTDAATNRVLILNFSSNDPADWKIYNDTIQSGAQVDPMASVNYEMMVRFSPDGNYLAISGYDGTTTNTVKLASVVTNSLDADAWQHASDDFGGAGALNGTAAKNETVVAWSPDSSKIVRITNTDEVKIAAKEGADTVVGGGSLFNAQVVAVGFNHDGSKLAVIHDLDQKGDESTAGDANTAQKVKIINTSDPDTTLWNSIREFDLSLSNGSAAEQNYLTYLQWHPSRNILAVTNGESAGGSTARVGLRDVHVFDLQNTSSSKWFEYDSNTRGGLFPLILDQGRESTITKGLAWTSDGAKFAVGSNKLPVADVKGQIAIVNAGLISNPNKWTLDRACFDFNEGTRLSLGVFDALRDDPMNTTAGKNVDLATTVLLGGELDSAQDYSAANALADQIVAGFETAAKDYYVDITRSAPTLVTKYVRYSIEQNSGTTNEINATGATGGTGGADGVDVALYQDNVVSTATAAALVGSGYAKKVDNLPATTAVANTDIIDPNATIQLVTKLVRGKLAKDNTDVEGTADALLPKGYLAALCGERLDRTAGMGVGGGRYNATGSTLGGPYESIKSYLDALAVDVLSKDPNSSATGYNPPSAGLIESYYGAENLTKNEKQAIARAIQLRVLMSGDEAEARDYFSGTADTGGSSTITVTEIAGVIKAIMRGTFTGLTAPAATAVAFESLDVSIKQEIAALAVLFGDDVATNPVGIAAVDAVSEVIQSAYNAATRVVAPTTDAKKLTNIRKHMAVFGALGAIAHIKDGGVTDRSLGTDTTISPVGQIGVELARGLLKDEHLKNLVKDDFGTSGSDGICADMSDALLSAVASIITLEVKKTAAANDPTHVGSYAAGLAYNQFFYDSLYRAIAKFGRQGSTTELAQQLAINSGSGDPTTQEAENIAAAAISVKESRENLSRARKEVQKTFESSVVKSAAPDIDHPKDALIKHFQDILKNPVNFVFNLSKSALFSATSEPRGGTGTIIYGHPENMAIELAAAAGLSTELSQALAADAYTYLCEPGQYDQVDAAAAHCDDLVPGDRPLF